MRDLERNSAAQIIVASRRISVASGVKSAGYLSFSEQLTLRIPLKTYNSKSSRRGKKGQKRQKNKIK